MEAVERYGICATWDFCENTKQYRRFWNVVDRWNLSEINLQDKYESKTKVYSVFAENLERDVAQKIAQQLNSEYKYF